MNRFTTTTHPLILVVVLGSILASNTSATEWYAMSRSEINPTLLYWQDGQLRLRREGPTNEFLRIVQSINDKKFDQALASIEQLDMSNRFRGELALAVAGHMENEQPAPALQQAKKYLQNAPAGDDLSAKRLWHELELYQYIPNQGWRVNHRALPARDLIREGKLEEGLAWFNDSPSAWVIRWGVAGHFQNDDFFERLLEDLEATINRWGTDQPLSPHLKRLIWRVREHDWAPLVIPSESLLYARSMIEPMRAYYWWYKQMGKGRPMAQQGFEEIIEQMRIRFPDYVLVRMYAGEDVPWGDEFLPANAPPNAPQWAVALRELRGRMEHIMDWWFGVKQAPDGQLGGGWEDDCETMRNWPIAAIVVNNEMIAEGNRRLANGIWENSGEVVDGWDRRMKDVEHSSEMVNDSSPVMAQLDYGDPLWIERCMRTAKTVDERFMGVNDHGHYHFKGMNMSATDIATEGKAGVDACYCARGMRSTVMAAWYSNHPRLVDNVERWALAWSEDTVRAGKSKPAGIVPTVVGFKDDNVDGYGPSWRDSGLGSLYQWLVQVDEIFATQFAAYLLTGNEKVLEGLRGMLELCTNESDTGDAELDRAVRQLRGHGIFRQLIQWNRNFLQDKTFDDAIRTMIPRGYERYRVTGDLTDIEPSLTGSLSGLRLNLPMRTTEVRGTDRVGLNFYSIMGPYSGGVAAIYGYPSMAVSWKNVDGDFTAMVRDHGSDFVTAWAYQFGDQAAEPNLHFWKLPPGRYELRLGKDENADTKPDQGWSTESFEIQKRLDRVSFNLPPQQLWTLEVRQLEAFAPPALLRPDLAVMQRDIKIIGDPTTKQTVNGTVTIHNIGSKDAAGIRLKLIASSGREGGDTILLDESIDMLAYPQDLLPKTVDLDFQWTPLASGTHTLTAQVTSTNAEGEICDTNNQATSQEYVIESSS